MLLPSCPPQVVTVITLFSCFSSRKQKYARIPPLLQTFPYASFFRDCSQTTLSCKGGVILASLVGDREEKGAQPTMASIMPRREAPRWVPP